MLGELERIRERHASRGFSHRDRTVLGRVQVPPLFGFVELRADGARGLVPPQPAEHIGRPLRLASPARWNEVRFPTSLERLLHLKPVPAVGGHGPIADDALRPRRSGAMPVAPVGSGRQTGDRVTKGPPGVRADPELGGIGEALCGPNRSCTARADYECTAARLRHAIVGGVQDGLLHAEAEASRSLPELPIFVRPKQLGHVLHDEGVTSGAVKGSDVLSPQAPALQTHAASVEQRKALTGRPADDDLCGRETLHVFDEPHVDGRTEVAAIGLSRVRIRLHGEDGIEQPGSLEAQAEPTASGEQIDHLPASAHGANLGGRPDDAQELEGASHLAAPMSFGGSTAGVELVLDQVVVVVCKGGDGDQRRHQFHLAQILPEDLVLDDEFAALVVEEKLSEGQPAIPVVEAAKEVKFPVRVENDLVEHDRRERDDGGVPGAPEANLRLSTPVLDRQTVSPVFLIPDPTCLEDQADLFYRWLFGCRLHAGSQDRCV